MTRRGIAHATKAPFVPASHRAREGAVLDVYAEL